MNTIPVIPRATINRVILHNKGIYTIELISNIISEVENVESYTYEEETYLLSIFFNERVTKKVLTNKIIELLSKYLPSDFIATESNTLVDGLLFNVLSISDYSYMIYL